MPRAIAFWGVTLATPPWLEAYDWSVWVLERLGMKPLAGSHPDAEAVERARVDIVEETECTIGTWGRERAGWFIAIDASLVVAEANQAVALRETAVGETWREALLEFCAELGVSCHEPCWIVTLETD